MMTVRSHPSLFSMQRSAVTLFMALAPALSFSQNFQAAPPPVRFSAPALPIPSTSSAPAAIPVESVMSTPQAALLAFGAGQANWTENAEGGDGKVIDSTDASYGLIQTDDASEGNAAFHLANPGFADNWFELDVDIDVNADTKLFFMSKLQYATSAQIARVEVSTSGGSSWTSAYDQPGSGGSGEGAFSLKEIDLGTTYSGQQMRIRFYYDFTGGSAYTGTDTHFGWLIDDIQIGTAYTKTLWSIGDPSATETLYLELINRSRADASVEAERFRDSSDPDILDAYSFFGVDPDDIVTQYAWNTGAGACMDETAQPMAFHEKLNLAADLHSQDMFNNEFQGHTSSASPVSPIQAGDSLGGRVGRVGYTGWSGLGENVYAYSDSTEFGHAGFEVDWGNTVNSGSSCYNSAFAGQGMQNPAGHRTNLHDGDKNEIGVGVVHGTSGSVGPQIVTQDLGQRNGVAYLCGVVYDDADSNDFYSVTSDTNHEGRSGIRVDVDGEPNYAVSSDSGAYALPLTANGTYEVTFSGTGIATFTTNITVTSLENVKLDHDPVDAESGYAAFASDNSLGGPTEDDDLDGVANGLEYVVAGMNPQSSDADALATLAAQANGTFHVTVNKRAGVTDMTLVIDVSTDLEIWYAPGILEGSSVFADTAALLTIQADASADKMFFRIKAQ